MIIRYLTIPLALAVLTALAPNRLDRAPDRESYRRSCHVTLTNPWRERCGREWP